jgi:hypothetical protein
MISKLPSPFMSATAGDESQFSSQLPVSVALNTGNCTAPDEPEAAGGHDAAPPWASPPICRRPVIDKKARKAKASVFITDLQRPWSSIFSLYEVPCRWINHVFCNANDKKTGSPISIDISATRLSA